MRCNWVRKGQCRHLTALRTFFVNETYNWDLPTEDEIGVAEEWARSTTTCVNVVPNSELLEDDVHTIIGNPGNPVLCGRYLHDIVQCESVR